MDEWEIDKPLGQCYGTGKKIQYGEEYFGALVETQEGEGKAGCFLLLENQAAAPRPEKADICR
jgi:hypothetical protein